MGIPAYLKTSGERNCDWGKSNNFDHIDVVDKSSDVSILLSEKLIDGRVAAIYCA